MDKKDIGQGLRLRFRWQVSRSIVGRVGFVRVTRPMLKALVVRGSGDRELPIAGFGWKVAVAAQGKKQAKSKEGQQKAGHADKE